LPWAVQPGVPLEQRIYGMRLRLKLTGTTAEGLLGGYHDVERWWLGFSKSWGRGLVADISGFSAPSLYKALHKYADGRPDPQTGANTAISMATKSSSPAFLSFTRSRRPMGTLGRGPNRTQRQ